jgi:hypothetical protein
VQRSTVRAADGRDRRRRRFREIPRSLVGTTVALDRREGERGTVRIAATVTLLGAVVFAVSRAETRDDPPSSRLVAGATAGGGMLDACEGRLVALTGTLHTRADATGTAASATFVESSTGASVPIGRLDRVRYLLSNEPLDPSHLEGREILLEGRWEKHVFQVWSLTTDPSGKDMTRSAYALDGGAPAK